MLPSPIRTSPFISRMVTSPACRSFTSSSAMVVLRSGTNSSPSTPKAIHYGHSLKAVERLCFAFVNVENGQEFRDREQVLKFLREVEKLQLSAFFIDRGVTGNEFPDAAGVDVADLRQVQKNTFLAFFEKATDGSAQRYASFADRDLSGHVKDGYISGLTLVDIQLSH